MKKQLTIRINKQLEMICQTLETTPEQVLQAFADNLSLDHRHTSGSQERTMAVEYFLRVGYGTHLFEADEIETMFDELNTVRYSFYDYGNSRESEYLKERNKQYKHLSKQWGALKAKKKEGQ